MASRRRPLKLPIPTHVLTGTLGSGKTTAVQFLLQFKPAEELWAVVVNEAGGWVEGCRSMKRALEDTSCGVPATTTIHPKLTTMLVMQVLSASTPHSLVMRGAPGGSPCGSSQAAVCAVCCPGSQARQSRSWCVRQGLTA